MANTKGLIQTLRKWQKTDRGHFVVYSMDSKRFMVPLKYLQTKVFRELFRMSEEEFGLPCRGAITLPCDSVFMNYVISLVGCCCTSSGFLLEEQIMLLEGC